MKAYTNPISAKGMGRKRKNTQLNFVLKKYSAFLDKEFTLQELLDYVALSLYSGTNKIKSISHLFQKTNKNVLNNLMSAGYFALARMSRSRFNYLSRCLDANPEFLAKEIEDSIASCYQHSNALAPDETMLPLKIRKMCHHMFIRGKPHPNGLLFTSMADYNRIMLAIRMRKRTKNNIDVPLNKNSKECTTNREDVEREPSTTTQKLIVNVSSRISTPNSFIVVDSLYGSYQLLEEMKDKKKSMEYTSVEVIDLQQFLVYLHK